MKQIISKYKDHFLFVLMAVFFLVVSINRDRLFVKYHYDFKNVNAAFSGTSGKTYVVDRGREIIVIIGRDGRISGMLNGGEDDTFY